MKTRSGDHTCNICEEDVHDEFQCSSCKYQQHYICALGFDPPDELKNLDTTSKFICAPCLVGSSYELLHRALDAHSKHSREKSESHLSGISRVESVADADAGGSDDATANELGTGDPESPRPRTSTTHSQVVEQTGVENFAPIHPADVARSKRLSMILNTLKNLPDHKTTLILGDSNTHGIKGDQVDPVNGTVAARSFSGLCIVAAVHALRQHKHPYRNIK